MFPAVVAVQPGVDGDWFTVSAPMQGSSKLPLMTRLFVQGVQLVSVPILTSADCPTPTTGADGDQPPDPKV